MFIADKNEYDACSRRSEMFIAKDNAYRPSAVGAKCFVVQEAFLYCADTFRSYGATSFRGTDDYKHPIPPGFRDDSRRLLAASVSRHK